MAKPTPIPMPSVPVLLALVSIVVHADELTGETPHEFDGYAIRSLLSAQGLPEYLAELNKLGLLPAKREP